MLLKMTLHSVVFTVAIAAGALAFNAAGLSGGGLPSLSGWSSGGDFERHDDDRFGQREWGDYDD